MALLPFSDSSLDWDGFRFNPEERNLALRQTNDPSLRRLLSTNGSLFSMRSATAEGADTQPPVSARVRAGRVRTNFSSDCHSSRSSSSDTQRFTLWPSL